MASKSFIPTRATMPSATMPSQSLASFKNQQLGTLLTSPDAPAGGAVDSAAALPADLRAAAAQTVSLSPTATKVVGLGKQVSEGNARLKAIQKAVAKPEVTASPKTSMKGQYTGDSRQPHRGQISVKDTVRVGNAYLRKDAANAFIQMNAAFKQATGRSLGITEGWRSYDEQVRLYNLYRSGRGNLAAKPGTSTHGNGTAVDINGYGDPNGPAFQWLRQNASRFGYKWTGGTFSQIEPWHWDYVG